MRPHRWQPTRLPSPWDSPGKNTGVGCHFLLQCMKVKSESEVAQLCPTLCDPMVCSLPGSSIHGIFQARVLEWGATAFSIWKDSLYLYLPESFCIFIACRSLPYEWVLWKDCSCGWPQKLSNLTHCVSLGVQLLLCGYRLCLADPDLSALLDWKEMAPLLRFSSTQHLIWCWTDQRMHGESHFPAVSTIQVMFMQSGIQWLI